MKLFAYFNGDRWLHSNLQHDKEWEEVIKDEFGNILFPKGFAKQIKDEDDKHVKLNNKIKSLDELVITHNTVAYDANGRAIGNMSAIMTIANFKYNQTVALGTPAVNAYQAIYKDTKIWWKGADNQPHEVMIESVCEALQKSMTEVSNILGL